METDRDGSTGAESVVSSARGVSPLPNCCPSGNSRRDTSRASPRRNESTSKGCQGGRPGVPVPHTHAREGPGNRPRGLDAKVTDAGREVGRPQPPRQGAEMLERPEVAGPGELLPLLFRHQAREHGGPGGALRVDSDVAHACQRAGPNLEGARFHFPAVDGAMSKLAATARQASPACMAATTRMRRSVAYGPGTSGVS